MTTNYITWIFVLFLIGLTMIACTKAKKGSGIELTKDFKPEPFNQIDLSGFGSYVVAKGDQHSVTITTDDNILPLINPKVEHGVLKVELMESVSATLGLSVKVVTPELPKLVISGAIKLTSTHDGVREVDLSGAALLTLTELKGDRFEISLSGASSATLSGEVTELVMNASGAGKVDALGLKAQRGEVDLSGAALLKVNASQALKVDLSGVGKVEYLGQPKLEKNVSGLGSISAIDG